MERPLPGGILLKESPDRLFSPESGEGKKVPRSGSPPGRSPDRLFFLRGVFSSPRSEGKGKKQSEEKKFPFEELFPPFPGYQGRERGGKISEKGNTPLGGVSF